MRKAFLLGAVFCASGFAADVRLTNDFPGGGYVSAYTLATGNSYTDEVLSECSQARGRQNEPSVAVNPRNTSVLVGSANDYCGVYAGSPVNGQFIASGPIWLGYYRSENGGSSFTSSLVPGYPGDNSPFAALADIRTASAGDPVVAWDAHGRAFFGAESSDDPAGTKKSFGDVWVATYDNPGGTNGATINDGKRYRGTALIARGSSAPNFLGVFHDKTAIQADRTLGRCDGNVYFAWTRFNGNGVNSVYFSRSTNHGRTWSQPARLTQTVPSVQDPDIAVTGNGNIFITFRTYASTAGSPNGIGYVSSSDCGESFGLPKQLITFTPYDVVDVSNPSPIPSPQRFLEAPEFESEEKAAGALSRDCGDFSNQCVSGYTFFRQTSTPRSTADQNDRDHEWVYVVYNASKPGTELDTGKTYGSVRVGVGSQSAAYFIRLDGATGNATQPVLIDAQTTGHQIWPDISADGGTLHVVWWDSRNDPNYSPARPIGNTASGLTGPSLDAWGARSTDHGATWTNKARLSALASNPNYEQFDNRTVPFAGDYIWITSQGAFSYAAWTDWRNTVMGTDPREGAEADNADVKQCRTYDTTLKGWTGDTCPRAGGLDQDIYGSPGQ